MKKTFALVLAALTTTACLTGCSKAKQPDTASDLAYIQDKGTLVVAVTDYAPMDYEDENGQWTGFDAEFARLVAEQLGVEAEFIEIDWDRKFLELNAKTIDCIWNGMTITDEVTLNTSCSNPYVKNAQVVVTNVNDAGNYTSAEDLAGLTLAVESGSAGETALKELEITDYVAVRNQSTALMEVAAGTADACVIDITMANAMTGEGTSYANLSKCMELTSEEYGVGFRKGSDMTEKFNELMAQMMEDGTLDALAEKYELTLVKNG